MNFDFPSTVHFLNVIYMKYNHSIHGHDHIASYIHHTQVKAL